MRKTCFFLTILLIAVGLTVLAVASDHPSAAVVAGGETVPTTDTLGPVTVAAVPLQSRFRAAASQDASELRALHQAGVLRHLGVPYAHFVTGSGDGLDVELIQMFAKRLGLRYEYVATDWAHLIPDLIGREVKVKDGVVLLGKSTPVRGDLIANGLTVLDWRRQVIDFSDPTFPTQIWLIARADSPLTPITPSGQIERDIAQVKALLCGRSVLGKANTCLEPSLYGLAQCQAQVSLFEGGLNDIAPAVIGGEAETSILDVPDSLVALEKWPGQIKVIGPVSEMQTMAVGFRKTSSKLRVLFNEFLWQAWHDGSYEQLVRKYYPTAFVYYPKFFAENSAPRQ